jgi:hypothetical protein
LQSGKVISWKGLDLWHMEIGTIIFYVILFLIAFMIARILMKIIRGY